MDNIDLKLLAVFDEIFNTGNISQAAEKLGIGQPAVSMGLRKLREHFSDPLFVRTKQGMAPTALAQDLLPYVRQTLALLHTMLNHRARFEPATSQRSFRVCMSDIAQVTALPSLLRVLKRDAPSVRVDITTVSEDTLRLLESGEVDLAIGFMPRLEAGIYQQKLLDERFVCIASAGHARVRDKLTRAQFQQELHMTVSPSATSTGLIDEILLAHGIQRTIAVRVPNFSGIAANIENTDYLVIVPERLGLFLQQNRHIKVFPLPFNVPGYRVMQHWHERCARDPGNRWLRSVVSGIFA
ncbi:LysR family transcriptional regulator [Eoetvoesiella caeni]|uniref:LysR family transcriptional regulator n=1 Tax=Eoetvoesiella caeni TaxID=645616 RepID=A0A366HCD9_9BURK|nr:LysR family transcriptional regulator [Eoetvoesiella caeni]MCI2809330.1 LysR family transcriptional regulator [Eoetvoesiella caeni]NYT54470.1 LysR family transcriptional regulator [Eoetvoesiella caeni]RBP39343.1 LysR family transcriptional regulator [Eoetvoesiella caeni]